MCDAVDTTWVAIFGPFKFLVIDGEKGIMSKDGVEYLRRKGITVRPRAPGQHARTVERRGAILRHAMHTAEEQLCREGIPITFKQLLAEATFAGNALVHYNGATPYHCRFGTQPAMLPDLTAPPDASEGLGRYIQRIREVALQKVIENTAQSRINRALRSNTTVPGEVMDYQPGELVEFYRKPNKQDSCGWLGPAKVLENLPERGQCKFSWNGQELYGKYPEVRRYFDFVSLVFGAFPVPLEILCNFLRDSRTNTFETFGYVWHQGSWQTTQATTAKREIALALDSYLRTSLSFSGITAARVARFPAYAQATPSVLLWWSDDPLCPDTFYANECRAISTSWLVGPSWSEQNYIQLIFSDSADVHMHDILSPQAHHDATSDTSSIRADASGRSDPGDPERLSVIPEEADGVDLVATGDSAVGWVLGSRPGAHGSSSTNRPAPADDHTEEAMGWALGSRPGAHRGVSVIDSESAVANAVAQIVAYLHTLEKEPYEDLSLEDDFLVETGVPGYPLDTVPTVHPKFHFLSSSADESTHDTCTDQDADGNKYVEILCPDDASKLIMDEPVPHGYTARLRIYLANCKKAVIDRDTDLLTPAEYQENAEAVRAAVLEELTIWVQHGCFSRRPRKGATNIIDVRWVGKWKKIPHKTEPGKTVRVIRMRLTLRGFKDREAEGLITYSGTASRMAQKLTVSEACVRKWPLTTVDVRKAFLKGLTYEELAATTNEPKRDVNFDLDKDSVAMLRLIPGFESFDPVRETLHNDKPGTGFKDAPRCFSLKLARGTLGTFGAKPLTHDDQLIVRHQRGTLDFIATVHVDDIKVACPPSVLKEFIHVLENLFGKKELEITYHEFTNCGMRHRRLPHGYSMDQIEYINAMKPIASPQMVGIKNDQPAPQGVASLYIYIYIYLH